MQDWVDGKSQVSMDRLGNRAETFCFVNWEIARHFEACVKPTFPSQLGLGGKTSMPYNQTM